MHIQRPTNDRHLLRRSKLRLHNSLNNCNKLNNITNIQNNPDRPNVLQEKIKQAIITSSIDTFVDSLNSDELIEIFKMIKTFKKIRNKVTEKLLKLIKKFEYDLIMREPHKFQKFLCHPLKETVLFDISMSDRIEYLACPPYLIKDDEYEKMCNVVGDMMKICL